MVFTISIFRYVKVTNNSSILTVRHLEATGDVRNLPEVANGTLYHQPIGYLFVCAWGRIPTKLSLLGAFVLQFLRRVMVRAQA